MATKQDDSAALDNITARMSDILKIRMRMLIEYPEVAKYAALADEYLNLNALRESARDRK